MILFIQKLSMRVWLVGQRAQDIISWLASHHRQRKSISAGGREKWQPATAAPVSYEQRKLWRQGGRLGHHQLAAACSPAQASAASPLHCCGLAGRGGLSRGRWAARRAAPRRSQGRLLQEQCLRARGLRGTAPSPRAAECPRRGAWGRGGGQKLLKCNAYKRYC